MTDFQTWHKFYNVFFLCARIDKMVEKNIQNKIWAQIFFSDLHVYMTEGYNQNNSENK